MISSSFTCSSISIPEMRPSRMTTTLVHIPIISSISKCPVVSEYPLYSLILFFINTVANGTFSPDFWSRIVSWIKNANGNEELEKRLFKSINSLFYIGPYEFNELYRQAYNGPIARWLIDKYNVAFSDPHVAQTLSDAVSCCTGGNHTRQTGGPSRRYSSPHTRRSHSRAPTCPVRFECRAAR